MTTTTRQPLTGEDIQDITEHINEGHVPELLLVVQAFTDIAEPTHAQLTALYADGAELSVQTSAGTLGQQFIPFPDEIELHNAFQALVGEAAKKLGVRLESRVAHWKVRSSQPLTQHIQRLIFDLGSDERPDWQPGYACRFDIPGHEHGRPYTLRRIQPISGGYGREVVVDVYCHDDTLGSRWAQGLQTGAMVTARGGRRERFPDFESGPVVLLGDETALPTIAALLDSWAYETSVRVLLEVSAENEQRYLEDVCLPRGCHVSWVQKGAASGEALLPLLDGLEESPTAIWGALEVSAAKTLRGKLSSEFPRAEVKLTGYWRTGETD